MGIDFKDRRAAIRFGLLWITTMGAAAAAYLTVSGIVEWLHIPADVRIPLAFLVLAIWLHNMVRARKS